MYFLDLRRILCDFKRIKEYVGFPRWAVCFFPLIICKWPDQTRCLYIQCVSQRRKGENYNIRLLSVLQSSHTG